VGLYETPAVRPAAVATASINSLDKNITTRDSWFVSIFIIPI
jgi:hypothetical protein